ncbi:RES domain-containing protein [Paenibacillus peoriae]|uniref:RES domain-containing protein n=1 Tax=Paenibacillus peoriae TaxID=59893 RepID=UPI0015E47EE1|nr:RES domain-containing protein [Paenibacillus peoriae]
MNRDSKRIKFCCMNCFEDGYIQSRIRINKVVGNCDYCGGHSKSVIPVHELTEDFEVFFEIYDLSQEGGHWQNVPLTHEDDLPETVIFSDLKPLHQHIQDDWSVFSTNLSEKNRVQLLTDIYHFSTKTSVWLLGRKQNIANSDCARFYDNIVTGEDKSMIWDMFCSEIKNQNRFILSISSYNEFVDLLHSKKSVLKKGTQFFRARIGFGLSNKGNNVPLDEKNLRKAPPKMVSDGRANPKGISYLYTASDVDTAVSEVRPWKSALVSVAALELNNDIKIVDLTLSAIGSPFEVTDLRTAIQLQQLLESISMEFSKPVSPSDSGMDYIPTQYIAELIKSLKYADFKFKSSIASGDNFVFFKDNKLEFIRSTLHRVDSIEIRQSEIQEID